MSKHDLIAAIEALLDAISSDDAHHGGLLSRATIRTADKLRVLVAAERRRQGRLASAEPDSPRQPRGPL